MASRLAPEIRDRTFLSGEVCEHADVPYPTLISWDKAKILRPSLRRKNGRRRYTRQDLVAVLIARTANEIGLPTTTVRET